MRSKFQYLRKVTKEHHGGSTCILHDVEVLWRAESLTMSDLGDIQ